MKNTTVVFHYTCLRRQTWNRASKYRRPEPVSLQYISPESLSKHSSSHRFWFIHVPLNTSTDTKYPSFYSRESGLSRMFSWLMDFWRRRGVFAVLPRAVLLTLVSCRNNLIYCTIEGIAPTIKDTHNSVLVSSYTVICKGRLTMSFPDIGIRIVNADSWRGLILEPNAGCYQALVIRDDASSWFENLFVQSWSLWFFTAFSRFSFLWTSAKRMKSSVFAVAMAGMVRVNAQQCYNPDGSEITE